MNKLIVNQAEELALRIDDSNENHHLWNNNGTWWIHYTIYPTPVTAERIRHSLRTSDITTARERRDTLFQKLLDPTTRLAA